MKNLKVSACQVKVLGPKKNKITILRYLKKAVKEKADIVCFPECIFSNTKKPAKESDLKELQTFCKENQIMLIINGYFLDNKKIYNRTYLIDKKGKILGYYDKIYLWASELKDITRGKDIKVIDTEFGKIGLCTCWDLFFPDLFKEMKKLGAEIVFCPSYWKDNLKGESNFVEYSSTVYAYLYMYYFVYVNCLLKGKISTTQISAPWGPMSKIQFKEGIITANLHTKRIIKFKNHFNKVLFERGNEFN